MDKQARDLPYTLRQQMILKSEIHPFESWWETDPFSNTTPQGQLAAPVHDLGLVPRIEDVHRATLKDAIKRYLEDDSVEGRGTSLVPIEIDEFSWPNVFAELSRATSAYEEKATKNPIRRCLRHGSGIERNLRPLVEGIPQDNGVGLVKGGLQIVLNAVQRRTQTCRTIFDTFESIPRRILHAELLQRAHWSDKSLRNAIETLYYELIKCLPLLISILLREDQSRWKKYSKSLYGDSKADVDEILKPTINAEKELQVCQQELISQGIVDVLELSRLSIDQHRATQTQLQLMQQEIEKESREIRGKVQQMMTELNEKFDQHSRSNQQSNQEIERGQRAVQGAFQVFKNDVYIMFQDLFSPSYLSKAKIIQVPWIGQLSKARLELMESLCDQNERRARSIDRAAVVQKHHHFSARALARANQLFHQQRFRYWVARFDSDILLVNGQCGSETMGSTSAISVVCAGLVETFSHDDGVGSRPLPRSPQIILDYFSGQHSADACGSTGPRGMMLSLLDQLLQQVPYEVSLALPGFGSPWHPRDLPMPQLCYLFQTVVRQLPPSLLTWCIIDNVSHFETILGGWADELAEIVECFKRCVCEQQAGGMSAPIKFLLAATNRSLYIWEQISQDQIDLTDGFYLPNRREPASCVLSWTNDG